jgi:hypothetical protein
MLTLVYTIHTQKSNLWQWISSVGVFSHGSMHWLIKWNRIFFGFRGIRVFDDESGPIGVIEIAPLHRGGASSSVIKARNVFILVITASRVQPVQWIVESKALVRIWEHDYLSFSL